MLNVDLFLFCGKLCISMDRVPGLEVLALNGKKKFNPIFESYEKSLFILDERLGSLSVTSDSGNYVVLIPSFLSERKIRIEAFKYFGADGKTILFNIGTKDLTPDIIYFVSEIGEIHQTSNYQLTENNGIYSVIVNAPDFAKVSQVKEIYLG